MLRRSLCLALAVAASLALTGLPVQAAGPAATTEDGTCPPLLRHTPLRLQDELCPSRCASTAARSC